MSTPDALATMTATLRHMLSNVASGALVTTKPPSTARNGSTSAQLNLFLYSTHYNPAFSNAPMPATARNGEQAFPPMPLVLKYLITAYGANDDDISAHRLMGEAMSLLHDHPLIGPSDIVGITPDSGLHEQIERVRITPDTLSLDDISKLWTGFQSAEYRLSAGYEVSVVLIESKRRGRAAVPVLRRGAEDRGASVIAGPSPSLAGLRFPNQKPAAELGDVITLLGENLSADNATARFEHPRLDNPVELTPAAGGDGSELDLTLPAIADDATVVSSWPAGFYALSLAIRNPDVPAFSSNSLSLPLSPRIESISPATAPAGDVTLTIECTPQIRDGQRVAVLFGDRTIEPDSIATPADPAAATTLTLTVRGAAASAVPYVLRLRVDGADSIPVDFTSDPPEFAADQRVTIT
ncbi:MAG: DUF4255 domain-containing protein [Pseudomonadota bacterium]